MSNPGVLIGLTKLILTVNHCQGATKKVAEFEFIMSEFFFLMIDGPANQVLRAQACSIEETFGQATSSTRSCNDELILIEIYEGAVVQVDR